MPAPPFVSIIIPCRNERSRIEACVRSALAQDYDASAFEVIIADGASDDGTRPLLDGLAAADSRLRVIDNPGRIVSTGMNAAIREAKGAVIVRMDAHTNFAPDYVRQCVAVLEATGADNVGGPARTRPHGPRQEAIAAAYHSPFSVGGARFHDVDYEGELDTVTYGCWRRELFDRVGGFDEALVRNQDDEHNLRIKRAGGRVWQSPSIRSWYEPRPSLRLLFRQYFQYGYWKVLVVRKHRLPASPRHLVPAAFVSALALSAVLSLVWAPARLALALIAASYGLALIGASLVTAARSGWRHLPLLPAAFACFHLGYGCGSLLGILDFLVLRRKARAKLGALTRPEVAP